MKKTALFMIPLFIGTYFAVSFVFDEKEEAPKPITIKTKKLPPPPKKAPQAQTLYVPDSPVIEAKPLHFKSLKKEIEQMRKKEAIIEKKETPSPPKGKLHFTAINPRP
ncbi:MAG: hypothetical protein VYD54_05510 [Bdellovibrionota bacterium]|nr:hypothetical protein [Bdellovibrionota bacterium]